ncbi:MAG: hypothetical protein FWC40_00830 [Proteobacteria bacterium]|nr:hypothetical protein [Pseudomonadota bacterium]
MQKLCTLLALLLTLCPLSGCNKTEVNTEADTERQKQPIADEFVKESGAIKVDASPKTDEPTIEATPDVPSPADQNVSEGDQVVSEDEFDPNELASDASGNEMHSDDPKSPCKPDWDPESKRITGVELRYHPPGPTHRLDFTEDGAVLKRTQYCPEKKKNITHVLAEYTPADAQQLAEKFAALHTECWKASYSDKGSIVGGGWILIVEFADRTHIASKAEYKDPLPSNYEAMADLLMVAPDLVTIYRENSREE